jgi:intracellular multiplication protein IcmL
MQNKRAAVDRRLSDPDFQGLLVTRSLALTFGLSLLSAVLVLHDLYLWTHPPAPKFFFVDGKNPPMPAKALDSPIVDDVELLEWTVKAVLAPYNVNYHDYPVQLNTAGRRFTADGWASFAKSYINGGNFEAMKKAMLLCYAQAQRSAVITEASTFKGALSYRVQVPIVQTCQNSQQANTQKLMITALVVRTNAEDHPDGLAIEQLVAKVN